MVLDDFPVNRGEECDCGRPSLFPYDQFGDLTRDFPWPLDSLTPLHQSSLLVLLKSIERGAGNSGATRVATLVSHCSLASNHNPRHPVGTPSATPIHSLQRHIASGLTNRDADVSVAAGTNSDE